MGFSTKTRVFTTKSYGIDAYTWSPQPTNDAVAKTSLKQKRPFFCSAVAGSNGEDWISTYSYNAVVNEGGVLTKEAYVECDYVQ